jgi:serine protease Do
VDAQGRLVGINDAIISPSGGNNGVGLAVPANMARIVMDRLLEGKKIARGYLGVHPQDIDDTIAKQFNLPDDNGALVDDVEPDSPADKGGVKSDDVIESLNGKTVTGGDNLRLMISELAPGSPATLKVIRDGLTKTIVVTLGALPDRVIASNNEDNDSGALAVHADMMDGVTVSDLENGVRDQLRVPDSVNGALVSDVDETSNAAEAGLRRGDIIVAVNGKTVTNASDAIHLCKDSKDPDILVKIWRRMRGGAGTRYLTVDNTKHG